LRSTSDGVTTRSSKEPRADLEEEDDAKRLAIRAYGAIPTIRITDVLSQVAHWTGFDAHFTHLSSGMPPEDGHVLQAALIAEATNLGLARMAEVCGAASRRAMLRMQTWHMREETFRAALACLTDAIHTEPLSTWFGDGIRASADGQAFQLGGPGKADGRVNAHYGRDPVVKIPRSWSARARSIPRRTPMVQNRRSRAEAGTACCRLTRKRSSAACTKHGWTGTNGSRSSSAGGRATRRCPATPGTDPLPS